MAISAFACKKDSIPSPWGAMVGLSLPNKVPSHPNRNMKHYKTLEILSIFNIKPPGTNVIPPTWT